MLWILFADAPWADLSARYGPYKTVSSSFYQWRATDGQDAVLVVLQREADRPSPIG